MIAVLAGIHYAKQCVIWKPALRAHTSVIYLSLPMQMFCCKDVLINILKIHFLLCLLRR